MTRRGAARALAGLCRVAVALCAGLAVGVAPAWAHVHVTSPGAARDSVAIVTFEVPNESQTGAATTELTVTLPDVTSVRTETKPGWSATLDRDAAAGTVRSVAWTASGDAGIAVGQFGLFRISMKLPDVDTVRFPAAQRYADGMVVRWDQPPLPGGGQPERPVPALTLTAGPVGPPEHHTAGRSPAPTVSADGAAADPAEPRADRVSTPADNPARLLGGAALLVAALGVTIAVTRKRT